MSEVIGMCLEFNETTYFFRSYVLCNILPRAVEAGAGVHGLPPTYFDRSVNQLTSTKGGGGRSCTPHYMPSGSRPSYGPVTKVPILKECHFGKVKL